MIEAVVWYRAVCDACGAEVTLDGQACPDAVMAIAAAERYHALVLPTSFAPRRDELGRGAASTVVCHECLEGFRAGVIGRGLKELIHSDTPVGDRVLERLRDWVNERAQACARELLAPIGTVTGLHETERGVRAELALDVDPAGLGLRPDR